MAEIATDVPVTEKENADKKSANGDAKIAAAEEIESTKENDESADEETGAELTKNERAIIRQVEYYFGDANLRRDKFLLGQIGNDPDGWVPVSVLLTFKRLADLTKDCDVVVDALVKSDEGLVEISDDHKKMRRHPERPIPEYNEELRKEVMSRTVYAKGFPLDAKIDELIEFGSKFEKVSNIVMRKYLDKPTKSYKFKGSVFITFDKKEQAEEFVGKSLVMYNDERKILRKWQDKYLEEKNEEYKKASEKKKAKAAKAKKEEPKFELPKGTLIHFNDAQESVTRESLREAVEKVSDEFPIAFIDYSKGNSEGYIRFQEENSAEKFVKKLEDNKLKLADAEIAVRLVTGEEEEKFLEKAVEHMKTRRNQHKYKSHHHGNRKRRQGGDHGNSGGSKKKKQANDD